MSKQLFVALTEGEETFDLNQAESFDEGMTDDFQKSLATGTQDAHERLYKTVNNQWILQSWTGHQRPQKWKEITRVEGLNWLDVNEWKPEVVTYKNLFFTRSIDETKPEFQKRVKCFVLAN